MPPVVEASRAWIKRSLAWSNSRQSWEERIGVAFLLLALLGALWLSTRLTLLQTVLVWIPLVLVAAALDGWLRLFGPILFFDLLRLTRRTRYFVIRFLYAVLLAGILCWLYLLLYLQSRSGLGLSEMAAFAEAFFLTFMYVQFTAVALLTPAYTAGAIAEEKERKTLEFLLITDLRDREIILSKLLARMANILLLVVAGLPILSFLQFLGGVDPNLVLAGFTLTGLTAVSLGGLSIVNSVLTQKPRDAIALTYMMGVAYLALSGAAWLLNTWLGAQSSVPFDPTGTFTLSFDDLVHGFNAGNIGILLFQMTEAVEQGKSLADILPGLLRNYALFHGLLTLLCCGWAILRLRAISLKQLYGQTKKGSRGLRWRMRPGIGLNPMIWKELFVEPGLRLNLLARVVVFGLFALSFVPLFFIFAESGSWTRFAEEINIWVRITGSGVACLLLLAVAARACSSISNERDRQTLDALLTSPLTSNNILSAKWLGNILCVRWGWLWLGLIYGLGLLTGGLHPAAVPLLLIAWFVYATVVSGIGLWFSLVCKTTLRATVWTLFSTAMAGVGHWFLWMCCVPLFAFMKGAPGQGLELLARLQTGITPPATFAFAFCFGWQDDIPQREQVKAASFAIVGLIFWIVVAAILWGVTSARFMLLTGRGRFLPGQPPKPPPRPRPTLRPAADSGEDSDLPEVVAIQPAGLRPPQPAEEPPPPEPRGAVLLEEEWPEEKPGQPPAGERGA